MRTLRLYSHSGAAELVAGPAPVPGDGPDAETTKVRGAGLQELVLAAAARTLPEGAAFLGPLGEVLLVDEVAA
ncbi:MAG TPA: hypothetical protein PLW65_21820, partial [Pseudomonadota bacterium]|nr:hypothetical protein [Pseudomonadota bacterium]